MPVMQGAQVQSLVGELRSHMPQSTPKKKKERNCQTVLLLVSCPKIRWHVTFLACNIMRRVPESSSSFMSSLTHGSVSLFNFGHSNRYFIMLLTWIFQMTHDIEHLFCAYLPSLYLLWWSTQGFAQVVITFPPLLLSVLYIFCTQFLY